ncbi:alpha/beta-hydrolase [Punctularia strigosozonata HHB-11173 SS5]|uniref:alpha/beta-hydrolase n=1 Tax=Punctularia strigosozonata (strain HHB-11173) TaxID=741275 RepID=UPI00044166AE|nr:alpha/beta-hydrolase [Punctularia strigosozonata HHB-11173 SS5]EIN12818.1 alpha/beta-hydrolase [Punctularia strigosozonata HHB-11173 SS5]
MLTSKRFVSSNDGVQICTYSGGNANGPALVLIPGFCCTSLAFEKQFSDTDLLKELHLVTYDVRGQGQSGQPLDAEAYESIRHAEDFMAVCDAYHLDKPFVAGWSLGGIIPADIATHYGTDIISGVILFGGFPYRSMDPLVAHPDVQSWLPDFLSDEGCVKFVESCVAPPADESVLPYDTKMMWIGAAASMHPLARTHVTTRAQDETKLLEGATELPYLVLQGEMDTHIQWRKMQAFMGEHFSKAEFVLLEGCGHAPFFEQPDRVKIALLSFVRRHRGV